MSPFVSEIIGTAILLLLGNGVVANALLKGSKAFGSGWIVITFGWGIAVFMAVFIVGPYSGAHINPAVTVGLAAAGKFDWAQVPAYIAAQMIGALIGSSLVWVHYRLHYRDTEDPAMILATFSTGPAIRSTWDNLASEIIGTFVLVFAVLYITGPSMGGEPGSLGSLDALPVALVVLGIGLSLGGPTGYAINPARDLGPRIAHALLPIANKGKSDWSYAWIPVAGPVAGGVLAAIVFNVLQ
ncbi:MAG: aquaporin family protein [Cytophagales bacterium]|nr:aquaporin family protein [Cytophagales bacterium]